MALTHRKKRPIDRNLEIVGDTRLLIIATEGRKTEKQYFAQFHNRRVQVKVAKDSGFQLAVSNPCFETWLLCHYILPTITKSTCQKITSQLSEELKKVHNSGYNKAKLNSEYFKPYIKQAVQNAKQLDNN